MSLPLRQRQQPLTLKPNLPSSLLVDCGVISPTLVDSWGARAQRTWKGHVVTMEHQYRSGFLSSRGMMGMPVASNIDPAADPDLVMLLHIVEESS